MRERCAGILTDEARLSVLSDRNIIPPAGVNGGWAGAANRYTVRRAGETIEPGDFPGKIAAFKLLPRDVLVMQSSGGGGFGDPMERSPDALAADIEDGFVTEAGRAAYAVPAPRATLKDAGDLAAGRCRLSTALATAIGASSGNLVELLPASGPARRFWVESLEDDGMEQVVWVGEDAATGEFAVRRLHAGMAR